MIESLWTETLAFLSGSSTVFEPLVPLGLALVSSAYVSSFPGNRKGSNNSVVVVCWIIVLCTAYLMLRQGSLSMPERVGGFLSALLGTLLLVVSPRLRSNGIRPIGVLGGLMLASVAAWSGSVAYMAGALPLVSLTWIFAVPVAHLLSRWTRYLFLPPHAGISELAPGGEPRRLGYGRLPSAVLTAGIALLSGGIGIALVDNAVPDHWASIGYVLFLAGHILFSLLATPRVAKTKRAGERQALQDEDALVPDRSAHASLVRGDDELAASSLDPVPPATPSVSKLHTGSVLHSLKWSFLGELSAKAITPVVFIVLARLLTPEDFGVMSAAAMVIAFSQIFWEAGMGKALIQRQTDVQDAANVAFWVNLALGCAIATLLYVNAESIASTFFHDPRVTAVLQVMTLQVLLGALSSVQIALLQKELGFKKLFWVRLSTVAFPGIASIPLAWNGLGYWALVGGNLAGQSAQVFMLWRISDWRPSWSFRRAVAQEMGRFGAWVGASGILGWFYGWADSLIVGSYLGTHELGLYRTGNQFAAMVFGVMFGPITPVLYSHLSRMNQDRLRLRSALQKVIRILILISVPIAIVLFEFSEQISLALFGIQWDGIGFVIGVMALMHGFSWVVGMNGEVYRAMGKPSYETIVTAISLLVYLAAYVYSIQVGFNVFVWTRLLLAGGAMILHLFILRRMLGVRPWAILSYLVGVAGAAYTIVSVVKWLSLSLISGIWSPLLIGGFTSVVLLGLLIYLLERRKIVKEAVSFVKGRHA